MPRLAAPQESSPHQNRCNLRINPHDRKPPTLSPSRSARTQTVMRYIQTRSQPRVLDKKPGPRTIHHPPPPPPTPRETYRKVPPSRPHHLSTSHPSSHHSGGSRAPPSGRWKSFPAEQWADCSQWCAHRTVTTGTPNYCLPSMSFRQTAGSSTTVHRHRM